MPRNSTPRTTRQLIFKGLAMLIGIVVIVIGIQERSKLSRARAHGELAVVDPIESYSTRKQRGMTTYSAQFSFKTAQGRAVNKRQTFPEELLDDFKKGTPVKVYYDPQLPSDFVFEKETADWWPFAFGAGFLLVGFFVL